MGGTEGGRVFVQRLVHPLFRPVMRLLRYGFDRRLRSVPHPVDSPHVHTPGTNPDRVLMFGSGPAVGYGVLSHDLALAGHLARQLSAVTGRGVDIDVIADPDVTVLGSLAHIQRHNLWRYDAILLVVGANDAIELTPLRVWRTAMRKLLQYVTEHVPSSTRILVIAIPPLTSINAMTRLATAVADRHSVELNRESRREVVSFPRTIYVPFAPLVTADDIRFVSTETYRRWASLIVAPLCQQLAEEDRHEHAEFSDEAVRQAELDALQIVGTDPDERFDRIVRLASQLFGTAAALTFVDHDRHWTKAQVGWDVDEIPRQGSCATTALHAVGTYAVEDLELEENENEHYGLRFYAGHAITAGFGERVGVLSVFSGEPRRWTQAESELLRDLALQVERELANP